MSYPKVLFVAELESLETRRNNQSRSFFQDICKPTSCLYHLIPPPRDGRRPPYWIFLGNKWVRSTGQCAFSNFRSENVATLRGGVASGGFSLGVISGRISPRGHLLNSYIGYRYSASQVLPVSTWCKCHAMSSSDCRI